MTRDWCIPALPERAGAYRWFYADVACGDVTAVFIFMVGSVFSARYAVAARRGGLPLQHCAVNLALYEAGRPRAWVLSEYPTAVQEGPDCLRIGRSRLAYRGEDTLVLEVDERSAPYGRPVRARAVLTRQSPVHPEVQLVQGLPHHWQPRAARAHAALELDAPVAGTTHDGHGYHDTNHGEEPLGLRLAGWRWTRVHLARRTRITYRLGEGHLPWVVTADAGGVVAERRPVEEPPARRTSWGLRVPTQLGHAERALAAGALLESSPFYARLEARAPGVHALGEVADWRRFHSPLIRWMAHFRTRVERAA